jgi:hypothetical protein
MLKMAPQRFLASRAAGRMALDYLRNGTRDRQMIEARVDAGSLEESAMYLNSKELWTRKAFVSTGIQPKVVRHHVAISGTGRAGTSFLVELLTHLGLDTGFAPEQIHLHWDARGRCGLENDLRNPVSPYIVKHPGLCDYIEEVLHRQDLILDHVFIPIREARSAAESRRLVTKSALAEMPPVKRWIKRMLNRSVGARGGLWKTKRADDQEAVLLAQVYRLILALADSDVPVTLLRFPRLVRDWAYLFGKLQPVLGGIGKAQFQTVFEKLARPELVNEGRDAVRPRLGGKNKIMGAEGTAGWGNFNHGLRGFSLIGKGH